MADSAPRRAMRGLHDAIIAEKGGRRAPHRGRANQLLSALLRDLIAFEAAFDLGDFEHFAHLGARSTGGTFDPLGLDIYAIALGAGNGSAADSWQAAKGWAAWGWSGEHTTALYTAGSDYYDRRNRGPSPLRRVGPTSEIKIAGEWWEVYEITATTIKIACYPGGDRTQRTGIRRQRLARAAWEVLARAEGAQHRDAMLARLTLQADVACRVDTYWAGPKGDEILPAGTVLKPSVLATIQEAVERRRPEARVAIRRNPDDWNDSSYTAPLSAWLAALPGLEVPRG